MSNRSIELGLCLGFGYALAAFGFASDNCSLIRSFNRTTALTNAPIVVSVNFTNRGTDELRGFYYTEQLPKGLMVTTLGVTLNGQSITNFTLEFGQDGDVYAGTAPCRWVFEFPTEIAGANAIPAEATLQILYSLTSAVPGAFDLQEFSWAAFRPASTNAEFGYNEGAEQQTVNVVATAIPMIKNPQYAAAGVTLEVCGVAGFNYAIETSTNLYDWSGVATNTGAFVFTDTNLFAVPQRFYRAVWVP